MYAAVRLSMLRRLVLTRFTTEGARSAGVASSERARVGALSDVWWMIAGGGC